MESQIPPHIGMGATIHVGTDRYACTIVDISQSGKTLTLKEDKATLTSGDIFKYPQEYRYEDNPNGRMHKVRYSHQHGWRTIGTLFPVSIGIRNEYRDPHF